MKQYQRSKSGEDVPDQQSAMLIESNSTTKEAPCPESSITSFSANIPIELHHSRTTKKPMSNINIECSSVDTSHFDMNLRKTRSESKQRRRKEKRRRSRMSKSNATAKFKELLVLKTESGKKIYKV
eukprot:CAMPEP_0172398444 /NCGR_PEP_ID=MMETSP1061-20121228/36067_1 /TAXON_ID=37318 /ORGANISM="Pseudo-nitzschia pungens, Strain cf. pungens" /LENGTH=125 /DNA_ID=CAMNT_0013130939 /DNA_START=42 /DNA_END=415 /DNA_ORIENTATION=+